ncbi:hypothetical protein AWB69_07679 [Caballeronia udeis]|uniref:Uncharacterized protein n=1 Tax=Caballeronia udeis TaxID=1232866 RepID=A0A158JFI6_9BURK|nr:hypothetical protein AWB69_07679 [Caballeronia udeis]
MLGAPIHRWQLAVQSTELVGRHGLNRSGLRHQSSARCTRAEVLATETTQSFQRHESKT